MKGFISTTSLLRRWSAIDQSTIRREYTSKTAAQYTHPSAARLLGDVGEPQPVGPVGVEPVAARGPPRPRCQAGDTASGADAPLAGRRFASAAPPAYAPQPAAGRVAARRGSGAHRKCAASWHGYRGRHGSGAHPQGLGATGGDAAIRRSRRWRLLRLGRSPRQGSPARPARGPNRTLFWEHVLPREVGTGPLQDLNLLACTRFSRRSLTSSARSSW